MTQDLGQTDDCLKIGENFELDLRAYQLRRAGRVLKLEPTPMELLRLLIEHRGQLVTRDQIVERIWGKDVFLDTDNGINGAIRKIRQVLKDDPEQPRFVETVSGKGYRFIASIEEVRAQVQKAPRFTPEPIPADRSTGTRQGKHRLVFAAGAIAAVTVATLVYFHLDRKPKLTDKDTIVVADFTNTTNDPVFDGTLRQGLAVELEQSPFLSIISEERIKHTLRLMGQPVDTRVSPEVAQEICQRTASAAVVDGSITLLGTRYVLGLRARNCPSGDTLDQEQVQVAGKEDVLNALGRIATNFRSHVGESLATIEKHDTPLAEATTPSLEALKQYSTAWKVQASSGSGEVIPLLERAIEIDPQFALAYAALGRMYDDIGESDLSAESTRKAYELRNRVTDPEKFFITASYDMQVAGDMEEAEQTCALWAQAYPRDPTPHAFLSGIVYPALGNFEKAAEEARQAIALDGSFVIGYWTLAYAYEYLGQLENAENALDQAAARKLEMPDFWVERYDIAFLKDDAARMQQAAALAEAKPGAEDWIFHHEAFVLAYSGKFEQARRMAQHAQDMALQAGQREEASLLEAATALREGFWGNAAEARRRATHALGLSNSRDVEYGSALAFALAGEDSRAKALADEMERRFPEDTSVKFSYLPSVRAVLALNQAKAITALHVLEAAVPYELSAPRSSFHGFFGALYPIYFRGEAFLAMKEGAKAAAEFEKILAHRGIVVSDPIGALARLQLARAYALAGNKTQARSAYLDFLTLWKDADRDLPILKQAKREYARLS